MVYFSFTQRVVVHLLTLLAARKVAGQYFPPSLPPTPVCGIGNYDTGNLSRPVSWEFTASTFCLDKMANSPNCTFTVSFCKPLAYQAPSPCNGAAVCQLDLQGGGSVQANQYRVGGYNSSIDPFIGRIDKPMGFSAQFDHGFYYDNVTKTNRTVGIGILFDCDWDSPWIAQPGVSQAPIPVPVNVQFSQTPEYTYLLTVKYKGACLTINPITTPIPVIPDLPHYLSAGTILIIIFICAMTLYCTVGCVAKACMGSKGAEIIPNSEMWTNLPGYTQDGCTFFFCQLLCCRSPGPRSEGGGGGLGTFKGYDSI